MVENIRLGIGRVGLRNNSKVAIRDCDVIIATRVRDVILARFGLMHLSLKRHFASSGNRQNEPLRQKTQSTKFLNLNYEFISQVSKLNTGYTLYCEPK